LGLEEAARHDGLTTDEQLSRVVEWFSSNNVPRTADEQQRHMAAIYSHPDGSSIVLDDECVLQSG